MRLVVLAGVGGCAPATEVTWLEGFGWSWELFNHRVSTVDLSVGADELSVAVVGGTSTTGVLPGALPGSCDPDTCAEFPFYDTADVHVRWARARTRVPSAGGSARLDVGADGATGSIVVPLDRASVVSAVLSGLVIETAGPVLGCYDPSFGWHPRRIAVVLGAPRVGDGDVEVPVSAWFEAGASLEEERRCIDEVAGDAVVSMRVDVQVFGAEGSSAPVSIQRSYAYSGSTTDPGDQPLPLPEDGPFGVDDPGQSAVGWQAIDFRFHATDPDGRGAYLRSLGFEIAADESWALGWATNHSPGTQLSGFDFVFEGAAVVVPLNADVERGVIDEPCPIVLEGDRVVPNRWDF